MKVLIVSPSFPPSLEGEGEHALQIGERLAKRGHEMSVLTSRRPDVRRPPALTVHATMVGWRWRQLPALLSAVVGQRPDAVVVIYTPWQYDNHPMITFLPTLLRWLRPAARLLVVVESARTPPPGSLTVRIGRKLFEFMTGAAGASYAFGTLLRDAHSVAVLGPSILSSLVAHSPTLADRVLTIPPPPLVVTPHEVSAAERERARSALGIAPGELVLAFFGYVYRGKGVETLLEALQLLVAGGQSTRLLMVGGGRGVQQATDAPPRHANYEAELVDVSRRLGVHEHVSWLAGYETGSDAPAAALLASDIAVLPFDDGAELRRSSIAVVAAVGLPVVTTRPAAVETAFVHGETVFLVDPLQPAALRDAILRVAGEPALAAALRAGASALVRQYYSWETAIETIEHAIAGEPVQGRAGLELR